MTDEMTSILNAYDKMYNKINITESDTKPSNDDFKNTLDLIKELLDLAEYEIHEPSGKPIVKISMLNIPGSIIDKLATIVEKYS